MDKLKKDNDTLKEELALETKQAMASNSSAAAAQIAKLQDQADTYTRKIEMEKRRIEELDKQIEAMEKNILSQRKKMGGVNAAKENHAQIQKQIKILENRLEKVRSAPALAALRRGSPHSLGCRRRCKSSTRRWRTTSSCGRRLTTCGASASCSTRSTRSWCAPAAPQDIAFCFALRSRWPSVSHVAAVRTGAGAGGQADGDGGDYRRGERGVRCARPGAGGDGTAEEAC